MAYIDLHTHSNYSDGTCTIEEIINMCAEKNIKTLSITDHDNIKGLEEAKEFCNEKNINLITGVELSATFFDEEIHILAYNFDINSKKLNTFLDNAKDFRHLRNEKMFKKFKELNIDIDFNDFTYNKDTVITRGDIANVLLKKGYISNREEAFNKYIGSGKSAYIKKDANSFDEVLALINEIGAISSIAHPNIYNFYPSNFKSALSKLKKNGLHAIECYHSSYNLNTSNTLIGYSNRFNLLKTGGSDFHGTKKTNVFLGQATSQKFIEEDNLSDFLNQIK